MRSVAERKDARLDGEGGGRAVAGEGALRKAVWVIVAAGVAGRVLLYLWRQSYWGDEAFLLLNLRHYGVERLLTGPLNYVASTQAGPPGFLLILKGVMVWLGEGEYAMRLWPLVCSVVGLVLFAVLAMRVLPGMGAVWAVGLFALSDKVVVQAATLKQYSGDVLAAVVLMLVARPWSEEARGRRLGVTAVLAAGMLWFSHTTVFVFGAISLAKLPGYWRRRAKGLGGFALWNLLVVASFSALYWFSIRVQRDAFLVKYWQGAFVDFGRVGPLLGWLGESIWELFTYPVRPIGGVLLVPIGLAVGAMWIDRRRELLMAVGGPFVLVMGAACMGQYPFAGGRVTLFLAPLELLLGAYGMAVMARMPGRVYHVAAWGLAVCLLAVAAGSTGYRVLFRETSEHLRPAIEHVRASRQAGEGVYVMGEDEGAVFRVYWPEGEGLIKLEDGGKAAFAGERFWVIVRRDKKEQWGEVEAAAKELGVAADVRRSYRPAWKAWALWYEGERRLGTRPAGE